MQNITKNTIKELEYCVYDGYLSADEVRKLKPDVQYSDPPEDLYLGFTENREIKKNLSIVYFSMLDFRQAGQYVKAMNRFVLCHQCLDSSTEFNEMVYREYQAYGFSEQKHLKRWAYGLLLTEMIDIDDKADRRQAYINHCLSHKIIDTLSICFLQDREKDILNFNGPLSLDFLDFTWLGDSVIRDLSAWSYDSMVNETNTRVSVHNRLVKLNSMKDQIPSNATQNVEDLMKYIETLKKKPFDPWDLRSYLSLQKGIPSDLMDRDTWFTYWFQFNKRRKKSRNQNSRITFHNMKTPRDKQIVKQYARYLFENTGGSINSIIQKIRNIQNVLNRLNSSIEEVTTQEAMTYSDALFQKREKLSDTEKANSYVSTVVGDLSVFYRYLCVHRIVSSDPWAYAQKNYQIERGKIKRRAIPPYVLQQIFKVLPQMEDRKYILIFLIMFDAGLRAEDAVALRKQDLVVFGRSDKDGRFVITGAQLNYYNHKFNHEAVVFISGAMAMLLDQWRYTQNNNSEYMFTGSRNGLKPIGTNTFRENIKQFFKDKGVRNDDGTLFNFQPHGLRHTCAVRMYDADIPIANISAQLDHQSIEMTIRYIDSIDRGIEQKNMKYINTRGEEIKPAISIEDEEQSQETIKRAVNKMRRIMLPNGMCNRPGLLSTCPHGCSCLTCSNFITSLEYLPVHRVQLQEEEKLFNQSNSAPEKATHEKNIEALESIIHHLEASPDYKPKKSAKRQTLAVKQRGNHNEKERISG